MSKPEMICKYIETCAIFKHYFSDKPQKCQEIMDRYCKKEYKSCARYRLGCVIGEQAVPIKLFPDMLDIANQLITNADKKRKSANNRSHTLIKSIMPEDIFDFALDLLAESTDRIVGTHYRGRDQNFRRFSQWFKMELQNYYAKIIQIKIKYTGIRSRKRGKNPLTIFLENFRRTKSFSDNNSSEILDIEKLCEQHLASLKIRVALFHGLKSKPLPPNIMTAIDSLLELEEARLQAGVSGIIAKYSDQK